MRKKVSFTESEYKETYVRLLTTLRDWEKYTTERQTFSTMALQRELSQNAR